MTDPRSTTTPRHPLVPAARYVRMSTDHQRYSIENQSEVIAAYAARRGYKVVATYADEARSGLDIAGRPALQRLIADVRAGTAAFGAILVYDVSRWGRFQDVDESAYYEYVCRQAGIRIHYCAEQFENDGSLAAMIIKNMKRAMAGEYSRELSAKSYYGQSRMVERGFKAGGRAGYGLRRQLIDMNGVPKGLLQFGEEKSLQTDRVILVPGPAEEVAGVQRIFRLFVDEGLLQGEIANRLNADGVRTDQGRRFDGQRIQAILTAEKYIGTSVYNRATCRLGTRLVNNPPELWIRTPGAFEAIVDADIFARAQQILAARRARYGRDRMLDDLRQLLEQAGTLSTRLIDASPLTAAASTYRDEFGDLRTAYALIGHVPRYDFGFLEQMPAQRAAEALIMSTIVATIEGAGAVVHHRPGDATIGLNDELSVLILMARPWVGKTGCKYWRAWVPQTIRADLVLIVRLNEDAPGARDFYLLPRSELRRDRILRLFETNGRAIDAFHSLDLEPLCRLARRHRFADAA